MQYVTIVISTFTTFVAAYIAAMLAYKNSKKIKYYEEKKKIYYELVSILPIVGEMVCQSDYLDGSEGHGNASIKARIMEIQLEDAKERLEECEKKNQNYVDIQKIRIEISNLEYKIEKHQKYLSDFSELQNKILNFEKNGNKNFLRIFACVAVWNCYIRFNVALNNEYNTDIGVTTKDIEYHIDNLINEIRKDLS